MDIISSAPRNSPSRLQRLLKHAEVPSGTLAAAAAVVSVPLHEDAPRGSLRPTRGTHQGLGTSARYSRRARDALTPRACCEAEKSSPRSPASLASQICPEEQSSEAFRHPWAAESDLALPLPAVHKIPEKGLTKGRAERSQVFWERRKYGNRRRGLSETEQRVGKHVDDTSLDSVESVLAEHWEQEHYRDSNDFLGSGSGACHFSTKPKFPIVHLGRSLHPAVMELADDLVWERGEFVDEETSMSVRRRKRFCEDRKILEKWQQRELRDSYEKALQEDFSLLGGQTLAERMLVMETHEVVNLAPFIIPRCHEVLKEDALSLALRLHQMASCESIDATQEVLREVVMALFASIVRRSRDAHGPDFLVEALVAIVALDIKEKTYVDILLSALFNWTSRVELKPELALRGARAMTAIKQDIPELTIAAGSRRAVGAMYKAIVGNQAMTVDRHILDVLDGLMSHSLEASAQ